MKLYTIHDQATNTYTTPVTIPSERDAIEAFKLSANDPKSSHFKHSPDYTLYEIGSYDQFKGTITPTDKKSIVNASALRNTEVTYDHGASATI